MQVIEGSVRLGQPTPKCWREGEEEVEYYVLFYFILL